MRVERKKRARINFARDYLLKLKPVIITDLYAGQLLGRIRTPAAAKKAVGNVAIMVRGSYEGFFSKEDVKAEFSDIGSYIDHMKNHPGTDLYCSEQETAEELLSTFEFPDESYIGPELPISHMFLGPKGMRTIFHWDGDHRHVLLTQIFGKKRVYLVSPEESPSMMPVFNMSAFNFQDLSPEEKVRFIRERNGLIADIGPGDTLFFPKTFWHYVEYVTDSMSVNVRFRSNLSENLFAACNGLYQVQMLGFSIRNENTALKVASEILRTFNRKYTGGIARYDATVSHLNAACMKHCTQAFKKARTYPDLNPERLALETRSPSVTRKPGYGFDSPIDSAALDSPHPIHQGRIENVLKILKPTPQQLAWLKQVLGLDALPGESGDPEETAYVAHVFQFFPGAYLPR